MSDVILRAARLEDAEQCTDIYSYYVKNTAITYEYDVPSAEEFRDRMADTLAKYPFIVAEKDGKILGYCYAGRFKKRAAYDRMVETTVYLDLNARGAGIGRRLYEMLEEVLKAQGIIKALAVITLPTTEEEKTVYKSVGFHERNGYKLLGKISCSGYKFGRWYDTVLMDKFIGRRSRICRRSKHLTRSESNFLFKNYIFYRMEYLFCDLPERIIRTALIYGRAL